MIKPKPKTLLVVGAISALALFFFLARSVFLAAFVNGTPISRIKLIKELEKQGGKDVLSSLIERSLIFQEAKRLGVKVGGDVVETQIKSIEEIIKGQNLTLNDALAARGQNRADLVEQITIQKTVEAILGQKINISDEDISKYFEENKELLPKDSKLEDVKEDIRKQLFQQKLNEEYTKWIAELKGKAKILYFVNF
ncbi:MAG: hypothetical protein AAB875_05505 [Patescibacteria group bacterium]